MSETKKRGSKKSSILKSLTNSLIGLNIRIIRSSLKEWEGKKGIIKNETSNMLEIEINKKIISIAKSNQVFEIETHDGLQIQVEGHLLEGYPEQRIKKKWRSW